MLKEWDKHFVIALLAGGLGILLYEMSQTIFNYYISKMISFEVFSNELNSKGAAGIIVLIAALAYALIFRKKEDQN